MEKVEKRLIVHLMAYLLYLDSLVDNVVYRCIRLPDD